jgi:hypothetical protein
MAKVIKTTTLLADKSGAVWVEAQLSEAQVKRVINSYKRAGIDLTPYGSPKQVIKQVEEITAFFANDDRSRSFAEAGKLQVIGVGF